MKKLTFISRVLNETDAEILAGYTIVNRGDVSGLKFLVSSILNREVLIPKSICATKLKVQKAKLT